MTLGIGGTETVQPHAGWYWMKMGTLLKFMPNKIQNLVWQTRRVVTLRSITLDFLRSGHHPKFSSRGCLKKLQNFTTAKDPKRTKSATTCGKTRKQSCCTSTSQKALHKSHEHYNKYISGNLKFVASCPPGRWKHKIPCTVLSGEKILLIDK